jgi:hypothetical protein
MKIRRLNNIKTIIKFTSPHPNPLPQGERGVLSCSLPQGERETLKIPPPLTGGGKGEGELCQFIKFVCINTDAFNSDTVLPPLPNGEKDGLRGILEVIL